MSVPIHEKAVRWAMQEFHNGVHEIPAHSNRGPRVEFYQSFDFLIGGGYPWCVDFFLACWANVGHSMPYKTAGAHDMGNWARRVNWATSLENLIHGDGIDFNIGSGHFGMYLDHTKTQVEVVNGNVRDAVRVSRFNRSQIRTCMHVPEVHNIPPHHTKQPLFIVTTSIHGHKQVVITQRTWKALQPFLPRLIKNRGWNGFTIKRVR
jgi:hypothetical protein